MPSIRRKIALLAVLAVLATAFSACSGGIAGMLGFDTNDYLGECVIYTHENSGDKAKELLALTGMLSVNSLELTPFSDSQTAAKAYRDTILNFMLGESYAKFSGNAALIADAEKEYPHLQITTIIPKVDFEGTFYKYFGGASSVSHESGALFTYLDRVSAYTTAGQPKVCTATPTATAVYETENTYRLEFFLTENGENSPIYRLVAVKREDGTCYMLNLEKIADKRVSAPDTTK